MEQSLLLAYLRLQTSPLFGPRLLSRLLVQAGSLSGLLATPEQTLLRTGCTSQQVALMKREALCCDQPETPELEQAMAWHGRPGQQLLCFESAQYPYLLRQIAVPPPLLYCAGNPVLLHTPICALVGSRKASHYGLRQARWIARELSALGLTIASGLARGIDAAAHAGALLASNNTIAVLGTGIDRVYPNSNRALAAEIRSRGLVLSEFPLGTAPRPPHFPQRNRIISGLSLGVVVVEASPRSGSLITAALAVEQNRNVLAVPGPIDHAQSAGCHRLLRDGAGLVTSPADICEELLSSWHHDSKARAGLLRATANAPQVDAYPDQQAQSPVPSQLSAVERRLLEAITEPDMLIDTVIEVTQLTPAAVNSALLQLEMKGLIQLQAGRLQRRPLTGARQP